MFDKVWFKVVAGVVVAVIAVWFVFFVINKVEQYQLSTTPTWTYVLDDSGIVVFETESMGYPRVSEDDWGSDFMAKTGTDSYERVRTEYVTMAFPFKVAVVSDPISGAMKFTRDPTFLTPSPVPSPSVSP